VIPARGGSKGIPRKNLRILNGKPLIYYSIKTCLNSRYNPDVYVSSDSAEILTIASKIGAHTHLRSPDLAKDQTTLDPVIYDIWDQASSQRKIDYDLVITCQATSPLLKTDSLDQAIDRMVQNQKIDSVISCVPKKGLAWKKENNKPRPLYEKRLNRQYLDAIYYETGSFLITRPAYMTPQSRIGKRVEIFELDEAEGIDIDHFEEWNLCEYFLRRKRILFVVSGYSEIGMGHIYRSLLLADNILNHEVLFLVDSQSQLGLEKIRHTFYKAHIQQTDDLLAEIYKLTPDVVITDALDTTKDYIKSLSDRNILTINFEDLGTGSPHCDILINALYHVDQPRTNEYVGYKYFCARSEFILSQTSTAKSDIAEVLISFGGTDPNNLTKKVIDSIYDYCRQENINIVVVAGLGFESLDTLSTYDNIQLYQNVSNISEYMNRADLAFTSAGRTTYELAIVATPSIVLAQNERELQHTFPSAETGFVHMGLGSDCSRDAILQSFKNLVTDSKSRIDLKEKMQELDLKNGVFRVVDIIQNAIRTYEFS